MGFGLYPGEILWAEWFLSRDVGFPGDSSGKEPSCQRRSNVRDMGSIPGLARSLGGGKWQPTPGFLPGESHGQSVARSWTPLKQLSLHLARGIT